MSNIVGADTDPLAASLVELASLLLAEETLETTLQRIVALAGNAIGGCDFASVTYLAETDPKTVVSTSAVAEEIDQAQYDSDSGPCLDASRRQQVVSVPSMAEGAGWTQFRGSALSHGVNSSLSLPMATRGQSVGALNLYGQRTDSFSDVAHDSARLFAAQAAVAVWNARAYQHTREVVTHLEVALETRDLIGQAKGVIMANEKVTADDAFAILRKASQRRNVKLRDLAAEVADTGITPEP
jgi:GAF domain-containing protein